MNHGKRPKRIVFGVRLPEALGELLEGIGSYVKQRQCNWLIECLDSDEFMSMLKPGFADAAITVISPNATAELSRVQRTGVPCVNIFHDCHPQLPSVLSDDHGIGAIAADYLARLGFRNFAFVGIRTGWSQKRQAGFESAIRAKDRLCHLSPTCDSVSDYHYMETRQAANRLRRWVRTLPRPVAIMGCSDLIVRALLSACEGSGLRVPEDAAILGVDNRVALCELASVPLSSIKQDFAKIGYQAASVLDRLLRGHAAPAGPIFVPPQAVVRRRSTEFLAFENGHISAAMRLIHERAPQGASLKELLREIPVSRKWIDVTFKALIGHTPSQEIRKVRIAHIREFLLQTDLSIRQIARRCGFSNTENLIRFFRQAEGYPPQQYRERNRS